MSYSVSCGRHEYGMNSYKRTLLTPGCFCLQASVHAVAREDG